MVRHKEFWADMERDRVARNNRIERVADFVMGIMLLLMFVFLIGQIIRFAV